MKPWEMTWNGCTWRDMPGQDHELKKMNFYLFRTGRLELDEAAMERAAEAEEAEFVMRESEERPRRKLVLRNRHNDVKCRRISAARNRAPSLTDKEREEMVVLQGALAMPGMIGVFTRHGGATLGQKASKLRIGQFTAVTRSMRRRIMEALPVMQLKLAEEERTRATHKERLTALRARLSTTGYGASRWLERETGVSHQTINNFKNGHERSMSPANCAKIEAALERMAGVIIPRRTRRPLPGTPVMESGVAA